MAHTHPATCLSSCHRTQLADCSSSWSCCKARRRSCPHNPRDNDIVSNVTGNFTTSVVSVWNENIYFKAVPQNMKLSNNTWKCTNYMKLENAQTTCVLSCNLVDRHTLETSESCFHQQNFHTRLHKLNHGAVLIGSSPSPCDVTDLTTTSSHFWWAPCSAASWSLSSEPPC